MKKVVMMVLIMLLGFASVAMATPVWLANKGQVDAEQVGNAVRYTFTHADAKDTWHTEQVAFCPDPLRGGCDNNIPFHFVRKDGNTMTWDIPMEVVKGGQSATNWANDEQWLNALWLGLPDCQNLTVGKNLIYYRSLLDPNIVKSGGVHLLYIGSGAPFVPSPGDPNIYNCGDALAKDKTQAPIAKISVPVAVAGAQIMGGGDSKAVVKGDDNDVTPQTVKQQAKQKTVIKGDNNTVRKTLNQVGINAKTTGPSSPITIHVNGFPAAGDDTCIKCHQNAVKPTAGDANGNIVTEQKNTEQKKEVNKAEPTRFGPLLEHFRK